MCVFLVFFKEAVGLKSSVMACSSCMDATRPTDRLPL